MQFDPPKRQGLLTQQHNAPYLNNRILISNKAADKEIAVFSRRSTVFSDFCQSLTDNFVLVILKKPHLLLSKASERYGQHTCDHTLISFEKHEQLIGL